MSILETSWANTTLAGFSSKTIFIVLLRNILSMTSVRKKQTLLKAFESKPKQNKNSNCQERKRDLDDEITEGWYSHYISKYRQHRDDPDWLRENFKDFFYIYMLLGSSGFKEEARELYALIEPYGPQIDSSPFRSLFRQGDSDTPAKPSVSW